MRHQIQEERLIDAERNFCMTIRLDQMDHRVYVGSERAVVKVDELVYWLVFKLGVAVKGLRSDSGSAAAEG